MVLARFQRLFKGREDAYGQWEQDNPQTVKRPITEEQWRKHLAGKGALLGIIPITETNDCYFGAIDVDDDTVDHASLAALIDLSGLPLVVCRSKSGGAHLYLFLKDPTPAKTIVQKLKSWAAALKLKNPPYPSGQSHPIEIFPKQTKISPDTLGNWINLPYYGNGVTNRYAVTAEGQKLPLDTFLEYAESRSISSTMLEVLEPSVKDALEGAPPCLNQLHQLGYPEGSRNMGLYNAGIYLKLRYPDDWQDKVRDYNQERMQPPLRDVEVRSVIKSLERRDYQYKCEDAPINAFCDKAKCKKQEFGIGAFRRKILESKLPTMSRLRKITTDPPRWVLTIEDKDVDLQTEDLMLVPRFRRVVLERVSMIFPLMKQGEWDDHLAELLKDHEVVTAPEDAGQFGQFQILLREFLLRRKNARSREDLLSGLPVEEGGKVLFRSNDLLNFLTRKGFKVYDSSQAYTALRSLGAGHTKVSTKGEQLQVWMIEVPKNEQTEDFDPVKGEDPQF